MRTPEFAFLSFCQSNSGWSLLPSVDCASVNADSAATRKGRRGVKIQLAPVGWCTACAFFLPPSSFPRLFLSGGRGAAKQSRHSILHFLWRLERESSVQQRGCLRFAQAIADLPYVTATQGGFVGAVGSFPVMKFTCMILQRTVVIILLIMMIMINRVYLRAHAPPIGLYGRPKNGNW